MLKLLAHTGHTHEPSGVPALAILAIFIAAVLAMFVIATYIQKRTEK